MRSTQYKNRKKPHADILDAMLAYPRQYFTTGGPMSAATATARNGRIDARDLEKRMFYTQPTEERASRHHAVQQAAYEFGLTLIQQCPNPSRELATALTKLEEARMWANAAIAHVEEGTAVPSTSPSIPADRALTEDPGARR